MCLKRGGLRRLFDGFEIFISAFLLALQAR